MPQHTDVVEFYDLVPDARNFKKLNVIQYILVDVIFWVILHVARGECWKIGESSQLLVSVLLACRNLKQLLGIEQILIGCYILAISARVPHSNWNNLMGTLWILAPWYILVNSTVLLHAMFKIWLIFLDNVFHVFVASKFKTFDGDPVAIEWVLYSMDSCVFSIWNV